MELTLEQQAQAHDNDYSALETRYRQVIGSELVSDPYTSARHPLPRLTLSASVVIPAWNAADTLAQCLIAIEQSSFNRKYGERLEVIVVDDGSTDGTWELLERLQLGVHVKAVRQEHHSRAQTQNTGIALAQGDVIISCDADMILAPFAIEELVKRHQALDRVMLLGFRGDVDRADPTIRPDVLPARVPRIIPPFARDVRLSYGSGGWPESMCRDSDHLKRMGQDRSIVMADGARWNLPGMVYGALFSLRRGDFLAMDGYDERFYGWGCEDTLVGVRALALGNYIVPVYGAAGLHVAHGDRSPRKWQEFAANRRVYQAILRTPFRPAYGAGGGWLASASARVQRQLERPPAPGRAGPWGEGDDAVAALDAELTDPDRRGKYLHALGRYDEAAAAFAEVRGAPEAAAWGLYDRGKALRAAGRPADAIPILEEAAGKLPSSVWPLIDLGLALAAEDQFAAARDRLEQARVQDPNNPAVGFILGRPAARHLERATLYVRQGDYALAVRDFEAALILEPRNIAAQVERAKALAALGRPGQARIALARVTEGGEVGGAVSSAAWSELGRLQLAQGELGAAKVTLERARRRQPRDPQVTTRLLDVAAAAARSHPLPLSRSIVEASQGIPGWLGADEAELLAALALQAAARGRAEAPARLVEIGSYCGRATILLALAIQGLGAPAQVISVGGPDVGPAPDGRPPRAVLRENLAARKLERRVVLAPEEDPAPWVHASHLVLVDGRHDYAGVTDDVRRYAPALVPGGLLVFHDYADYFPDVLRCVDELLLGDGYDFVAQAGSLIALCRRISQGGVDGASDDDGR